MRVVLISAVDPYPTDAGKKVVLAGFVDYFAERYGPDNVHYIKVGAPPQHEFPVSLHLAPAPRRPDVLRTLATKAVTGRGQSAGGGAGLPGDGRGDQRHHRAHPAPVAGL